jgi:enoyl-CoA hydratase
LSDSSVPSEAPQETAVTVERRGHLLLIGLNRPAKRNAFDVAMIEQLAAAYYDLEHDEDIRCGVLFGHGDHFTGGLDLGGWCRSTFCGLGAS